jgi:hypothetical protein
VDALLIGVAAGLIVAFILAVLKKPRTAILRIFRAALNRPHSKLHLVLGPPPVIWTPIDAAPEGRCIAWRCQIVVTNEGNRTNAPVRGVLRWKRRDVGFATPLSIRVPIPGHMDYHQSQTVVDLTPNDTARLTVHAWTPLRDKREPSGTQRARLSVIDRYNTWHRVKVDFASIPPHKPMAGSCGKSTINDEKPIRCDLPSGHGGFHSAKHRLEGAIADVVTTWDDDKPGQQDYVVMP